MNAHVLNLANPPCSVRVVWNKGVEKPKGGQKQDNGKEKKNERLPETHFGWCEGIVHMRG